VVVAHSFIFLQVRIYVLIGRPDFYEWKWSGLWVEAASLAAAAGSAHVAAAAGSAHVAAAAAEIKPPLILLRDGVGFFRSFSEFLPVIFAFLIKS